MTVRAEAIMSAPPRWWARPTSVVAGLAVLGGIEAVICLRRSGSPMLAADVFLGVLAVVLGVADLTVKRLPARIVWPSYPVALGLLAIASANGAGWGAFVRALLAMIVCGAIFLAAALALPRGLGLGDVSLAGLLGAYCGFVSWPTVDAGVLCGFLLGTLVLVPIVELRRLGRKTPMPFGPFLLAGALAALLIG